MNVDSFSISFDKVAIDFHSHDDMAIDGPRIAME